MIVRLIILFTLSAMLFSCGSYDGNVNIQDASKDTIVLISSRRNIPSVLVVKLKGNIDSDVEINSILIPKGNVNKKLIFDSYTPIGEIIYEHKHAQNGNLTIYYRY